MHAKYIMMINLVKVLLEKISINYVPVWFSGGKGLTHVGVKLEFLSFSFHGQKVHWDVIFSAVADFKLHTKHTLHPIDDIGSAF